MSNSIGRLRSDSLNPQRIGLFSPTGGHRRSILEEWLPATCQA
jgi:hypothetical protein